MKTTHKKSFYRDLWITFAAVAASTVARWFHPATINSNAITLLWIGFFVVAGIIVTADNENLHN